MSNIASHNLEAQSKTLQPSKTPQPSNTVQLLHSKNLLVVLFVIFGLLAILPLWIVKYPPLIDYPNHLARAFILNHLHDPHYLFGHFYAPDWGPNPYYLADFLVQVFQKFVSIYAAGRLLLTLCILGLPLSVAFFLHRANPGSEYLALWAFAVTYNPNFLMGFMSFELSIALCFIVVGVWLDYMRTDQEKYWILTVVLATLLFLTHLGGFAIAGVALMVYTALTSGFSWRLVRAGLVFVPGAAFFLYDRTRGWSGRGLDYTKWSINLKLKGMVVPFKEYSRLVEYFTIAAVLVIIGYLLTRRRNMRIQYVWMAVVVAVVAVHWVAPDAYGDLGFVDYRFCIFAFLFALAIPVFRGSRALPVALASAVFLLHVGEAGKYFTSEQKHLDTLASEFQYIPRNAMVIAYTSRGAGVPWEKQDDLHFWGYGVIDRGWITPSVFHQSGVQPLVLRVPMYADDDQYGDGLQDRKYSPELVGENYDYLWATNVGYLDPYLDRIADRVVSNGALEILKSRERGSAAANWESIGGQEGN
jgi:hypothetical protein